MSSSGREIQPGEQGVKGDPGGWVSTSLGNVDLNTVTVEGLYRQTNSANATALNNYPQTNASCTIAVRHGLSADYLIQEHQTTVGPNSATAVYRRSLMGGVWSAWKAFYSHRLSNTAGRAIYEYNDTTGGEQLVYGDTGWRALTANAAYVVADDAATYIRIRRVGQHVTLVFRVGVIAANGSGVNILDAVLPSGFRPYFNITNGAMLEAGTAKLYPAQVASSGDLRMWYADTSGTISHTVTFPTNEAWPATLPGTASGTIPNL